MINLTLMWDFFGNCLRIAFTGIAVYYNHIKKRGDYGVVKRSFTVAWNFPSGPYKIRENRGDSGSKASK